MILLNAAESRELDRLSQDKYGIASYSLMTRAGEEFAAKGGKVVEVTVEGQIESAIGAQRPAAVVDAIFGTGLNAEVKGLPRRAIEMVNSLGVPVAAVDIASGVNADTGAVMGVAIRT